MTRRKMKDSGVAWIGQVPEGWRCSRMKYEVSVRDESRKYDPHADKYIGLENLISYGTAVYETESAYPEAIYACCRKDDVLFSKLRPYLAKCVLSPLNGFCTGEFVVFKEFAGDKRFLRYWLLSDAVLSQINASTYGAKMPRASEKFILNMPFLSPPLAEQRKIAAFLDGECGKIDVLRGKVEKQIAALEEYRKSVITEAVTRGVKRGRKMKPSGIEWVGEINADWRVVPNKYLMHKSKCICTKWSGENIVSLTMNGVVIRDIENPVGKMPASFDGYQYVETGDLLMCLFDYDVTPRTVGRCRVGGVTSPAYSRYKVNRQFLDLDYVYYYYLMVDDRKAILHRARNLRHSFSDEEFGLLKMPVPSLAEQHEIAAYLDKKCAAIDSMVAKCREELDRLAEYKKSLIYEYVTGKKEVA